MQRLLVNLVALTALMTGLYLSAHYFSEPVVVSQPVAAGDLIIRRVQKLGPNGEELLPKGAAMSVKANVKANVQVTYSRGR